MSAWLGGRIRRARLEQGLTQAEIARKVGVATMTISNWERGESAPQGEKIKKLERVLGRVRKRSKQTDQESDPLHGNVFGTWLSRNRSEQKMSVPELAEASGLSTMAIYNIESGRSLNPQAATRGRLEKVLGKIPTDVKEDAADEQRIEGLGSLTDFDPHDKEALPDVGGVYVFYDVSDRPIYVGQGQRISKRVKDHEEKFWFKTPIVVSASYVQIDNDHLRKQVEQVLIKFLKSNAVINKQSVDR